MPRTSMIAEIIFAVLLQSSGHAAAQQTAPVDVSAVPAAVIAVPGALSTTVLGDSLLNLAADLPVLPKTLIDNVPITAEPASEGSEISKIPGYSAAKNQFGRLRRAFRALQGESDVGKSYPALSQLSRISAAAAAPIESAPAPQYPSQPVPFHGITVPSFAARPDRPVEPLIISAIDAAQHSLYIAAHEIKSREIVAAIRRARARGIEVDIVVDYNAAYPEKSQYADFMPRRSAELQALVNDAETDRGLRVRVLRGVSKFGSMDNRFMVLDGQLAQFGSYDYSFGAERSHYDNVIFTANADRVAQYLQYARYLNELSVPFSAARSRTWPSEVPAPPQAQAAISFNGITLPSAIFAPGNAESWIVRAIDSAKTSIDVSAYGLRSTRIAQALAAARERGVKVRVILDQSQFGARSIQPYALWLSYQKIPVVLVSGPDKNSPEIYRKNHNRFMIVDGGLVETGSLNWTKQAFLGGFGNANFSNDPLAIRGYAQFFQDMFARGTAVSRPQSAPRLPTDEQLARELAAPLPEPPAPPAYPPLPAAPEVNFNGEAFPAYAMRPEAGVRDQLIRAIDSAQKSIHIALYEFNQPDVLDALRRAKSRKGADGLPVDLRILIDYSHVFPKGKDQSGLEIQVSDEVQSLIREGFDVRVVKGGSSGGIMHNKFAVFDGKMAEFGSYNWSTTSESDHFENVIFTAESQRVDFYEKYWQYMSGLSSDPRTQAASSEEGLCASPARREEEARPCPQCRADIARPAPRDSNFDLELNGARFPRTAVSPYGGVESLLIMAIEAARDTVDVAMFSFYSRAVAEALLSAKKRGVAVRIVLDESQSKLRGLAEWFVYQGFDVRITAGPDDHGDVFHEKMHNKLMIVDGKLLETGSYNYSDSANIRNFDNANFFTDPEMLKGYIAYFDVLYQKGWKPKKPKKLPEPKASPADFFGEPRTLQPFAAMPPAASFLQ